MYGMLIVLLIVTVSMILQLTGLPQATNNYYYTRSVFIVLQAHCCSQKCCWT